MMRILRNDTVYRIGYSLLVVLLAAGVFRMFITDMNQRKATFEGLVYGTAYRPYVSRALMPTAVRVLTGLVPKETRESLTQSVDEKESTSRALSKLGWDSSYMTEYLIAAILMFAALLGFVRVLRYLFTGIYVAPERFTDLTCLLTLLGLPPFFLVGTCYVYDLFTLFFFTLGLALMARRKWRTFLLVFLLACLNKETTIFLTLVFIIHFHDRERMARPVFKRLLLIQLFIFTVIKFGLFLLFQDNPGGLAEFHLVHPNLYDLRAYSFPVALTWFSIGMLVFYKWQSKPRFLKDAIWIAVPLVVLVLFFGRPKELRAYYEVYPIAMLLIAHSIAVVQDVPIVDRTRKDQLRTPGQSAPP